MLQLGVNIDHVATLRQARYALMPDSPNVPSLICWTAAHEAQAGGASSITVHLRADRRHIQDKDVWTLKKASQCEFESRAWATPWRSWRSPSQVERPDFVSSRAGKTGSEITTEGGLDVAGAERLRPQVTTGSAEGKMAARVSFFIDPVLEHVRLSQ